MCGGGKLKFTPSAGAVRVLVISVVVWWSVPEAVVSSLTPVSVGGEVLNPWLPLGLHGGFFQ